MGHLEYGIQEAAELYTYAYPLVMLELTHAGKLRDDRFYHLRQFPTEQDRKIVRPNRDTLYSIGFTQLKNTPYLLRIADIRERYYLVQVMNAYTEVIASIGTRTPEMAEGDYLFLYQDDEIPQGYENYKIVRSDDSINHFLVRTETRGEADYAFVNQLQDTMIFQPLYPEKIADTKTVAELLGVSPETVDEKVPPVIRMDTLDISLFLKVFAESSLVNPITDPHIEAVFTYFGYEKTTGSFDYNSLSPQKQELLAHAQEAAFSLFRNYKNDKKTRRNNWSYYYNGLGAYGNDYLLRAQTAYIGYGANLSADCIYPFTYTDSSGEKLKSERNYILHFAKDGFPHAAVFWSVTVYGEPSQSLAKNAGNRYTVSSYDLEQRIKNEDGSLDIFLSREEPEDQKRKANWLPVPTDEDEFSLVIRIYYPDEVTLEGKWDGPDITAV